MARLLEALGISAQRFGRALSGILSERAEDCPTARDLVLGYDGPDQDGADRHHADAERPVTDEAETVSIFGKSAALGVKSQILA
jgi:hypothetical protein